MFYVQKYNVLSTTTVDLLLFAHALDVLRVVLGLLDHLATHATAAVLLLVLFHSGLHRVDLGGQDVQFDELALLCADLLQFVRHGVIDIAMRALVCAHHQHDVAQCRIRGQTPVLDRNTGCWLVRNDAAVNRREELVVGLDCLFYNNRWMSIVYWVNRRNLERTFEITGEPMRSLGE